MEWPPAGWSLFDLRGTGTWPEHWEPVAYRSLRDGCYALRVPLQPQFGNRLGGVHGAFLAGLGEHCLGVPYNAAGLGSGNVTVSLAFDYPAGATTALPLDGEVELLRETGRMMFLRLLFRQGDDVVLSGTGTLRKL